MKVCELEGAELDYWVAMAGREWENAHKLFPTMTLDPTFSGVELRDYPRGEHGALVPTCVLIPRNPFRQDPQPFCPSTEWAHGGPIIQRIGICIGAQVEGDSLGPWEALCYSRKGTKDHIAGEWAVQYGEAPLIAAMRAYVASVFGEEVNHPKDK